MTQSPDDPDETPFGSTHEDEDPLRDPETNPFEFGGLGAICVNRNPGETDESFRARIKAFWESKAHFPPCAVCSTPAPRVSRFKQPICSACWIPGTDDDLTQPSETLDPLAHLAAIRRMRYPNP